MGSFLFRGFKSAQQMLENGLGSLERDVMRIVWAHGNTTVRDACGLLNPRCAYTTVMTTMDRLYRKGLLGRIRNGRAFVYHAMATEKELEADLIAEIVQTLLERNAREPMPILSSLVDAVSERDYLLLEELERLIQEKRSSWD